MWTSPFKTQRRELLLTFLGYVTRPTRSRLVRLLLAAVVGAGVLVLLAACGAPDTTHLNNAGPPGIFPPTATTEQASNTGFLYGITLAIATIVFVIVEGLLVIITLRFRRKATDVELPKQTHGNNVLEVLWTLIPAVTVLVLFGAAVVTLNKQEALSPNPAVVVNVTGFQWQWTFEYPNQGGISFTGSGKSGPELVIPTAQTIRIRLQSKDVIHSFYVPLFNYKLDVIPGRINEFDVTVDNAGTYGGQCAEFCGLGHADMFFTVRAVSKADFDAWVAQAQAAASATPPPVASGGQPVNLTAVNTTTFDPATLSVKANQPITFTFKNADGSVQHDVAIEKANPDGSDWQGLPVTEAGQTATYGAPALAPGTYTFYCIVHPQTMRGTLTVTP
jgi:cytochrome c oxidase subunit II